MQRRRKSRAKTIRDDEEIELKSRTNHTVFSDSDDEAANEDLTLKIIEKAMARASHASDAAASTAVDGDFNFTCDDEMSEGAKKKKVKKVKKTKKKKQKIEEEVDSEIIQSVPSENTGDSGETPVDALVVNLSDPSAAEKAAEDSNVENVVLRRLLRGPRYFDPPDKSWGACFNCGEEGHSAVNCTSARRKKPCFVCGSLEHEAKQCQKGQDCFICKGQGHRAKDCPQKMKRCSLASELCLKCGAYGHMMFSCNSDYSPDDLKDIQCYVCKRYGHLCCANYFDALASEASCFKCGHPGHHGQDCRGSKGETSAGGTPSSCFKCGDEGHFARECKTSGKAKKRTRDSSTPVRKKYPKDKKGNKGYNSAPQDFGKTHRKKHLHFDDESPNWSSKPKRRGGWIPDDSSDHHLRNGWRSPSTPNKNHRIFDLTYGGHGSSPQYFSNRSNYSHGSSSSRGYYEHKYTASRFGHPTDSRRRNNDWW
ncbi:hypothetical protein RND81_05G256800 [Saponaria officinalis]|uniref:CCHC-type domain-containing protein n=1 Tax=Saponaria officinalis TaxID=3572 RepID=A0AAW1L2B4_SAPOF